MNNIAESRLVVKLLCKRVSELERQFHLLGPIAQLPAAPAAEEPMVPRLVALEALDQLRSRMRDSIGAMPTSDRFLALAEHQAAKRDTDG
jgi:hypothetical protein